MQFFFVSEDINLDLYIQGTNSTTKRDKYKFKLTAPTQEEKDTGEFKLHNIYLSNVIHSIINKELVDQGKENPIGIYAKAAADQIIAHPNFPKNIGAFDGQKIQLCDFKEKISPLLVKKEIKIAIFLSSALGDMLRACRALELYHSKLLNYFDKVSFDLLLDDSENYKYILDQSYYVNKVCQLPISLKEFFNGYDAYVELNEMLHDYNIKDNIDTPIIDIFLQGLNIDSSTISDSEKRNFIKVSPKAKKELSLLVSALKSCGKRLLLFNPLSSNPIRSIPQEFINKIIEDIIEKSDYQIISFSKLSYNHERFIELGEYTNNTENFLYLLSQMDAIITVDTSVYHVADAFNIPTYVIFATLLPQSRCKYYPLVGGINIGSDKLKGKFVSKDADDIDELNRVYSENLDISLILRKLKALEKEKFNDLQQKINCPICGTPNSAELTDRLKDFKYITCAQCETEFCINLKDVNIELNQVQDSAGRYKKVLEFLKLKPNKTNLLEIGCKTDYFIQNTKKLGYNAYGLVLSPSAGLKFNDANIQQIDSLKYSLPNDYPQKYGVIATLNLENYTENINSLITCIKQNLENNGIWIIVTPNKNRLHYKLGNMNPNSHKGVDFLDLPPESLLRFSPKGHGSLLSQAGFTLIYQGSEGISPEHLSNWLAEPKSIKIKHNGKHLKLNQNQIKNNIYDYTSPLLPELEDNGNYIITIAQFVVTAETRYQGNIQLVTNNLFGI